MRPAVAHAEEGLWHDALWTVTGLRQAAPHEQVCDLAPRPVAPAVVPETPRHDVHPGDSV